MRGITVTLYEKLRTGTDALNKPIYTETPVQIDNVLVAPVSVNELPQGDDLNGAKEIYQLGIPKGDTHDWYDSTVKFFGKEFRTIGPPIQGIEALIPLSWNAKVTVARYE